MIYKMKELEEYMKELKQLFIEPELDAIEKGKGHCHPASYLRKLRSRSRSLQL